MGTRTLANGRGQAGMSVASPVGPEWLSSTIGAIYDCVLEPAGWQQVLADIANEFAFGNVVLGVMQTHVVAHRLSVQYGYDEEWLRVADGYAPDFYAMWGGPARLQAYPLDEPVVLTDVTSRSHLERFGYYREIIVPRGYWDVVGMAVAREPNVVGYLAFSRHSSAGEVGQRELQGLRLLGPHIRRAVTISNLFDLQAVKLATFRSFIDGLSTAVILVDEALNAIHTNARAMEVLSRGGDVRVVQGRLASGDKLSHAALATAVQQAASDEAQLAVRGIGIPIRSPDGASLLLHVLPLNRGELRPGLWQRAVAAVFVVDVDRALNPPSEAVALLYELSPAEHHVFRYIAEGRTLEETAGLLGVARSTAKTHLLNVFTKTGTRRQADLLALASRLSPQI
jgi:DNA-binding CsgD family transcriptional regulator